jgi:pseudouridine-5'-phosphate glycosidase/pseudouridine kinase
LISHIAPNVLELTELYTLLNDAEAMASSSWWSFVDGLALGGEWRAMLGTFASRAGRKWVVDQGVAQMMVGLLPWVSNVWVKNGDNGAWLQSAASIAEFADVSGLLHLRISNRIPSTSNSISTPLPNGSSLILTHYPAAELQSEDILSTTGAGDSLVGGLAAGIVSGKGTIQDQGVREAVMAATRSLGSLRAVAPPVAS